METAVGVFQSREVAEQAVKELLRKHVPQESIVFLTRSETDAHSFAKELGSYAGGFAGGAVGMAAGAAAIALALVPGVGQVFALGIGATALLGYLGAKTGGAVGKSIAQDATIPAPTPDQSAPEDAATFINVLKQGHSLIVVRTEFHDVARVACEVLDRLGLAMPEGAPTSRSTETGVRHVDGVAVIDLSGKLTFGEGSLKLRDTVKELLTQGSNRLVVNLSQLDHIDSSGIGELVRGFASVRNSGGQMKLAGANPRVQALLEATHLDKVFEIYKDEPTAVRAFHGTGARATAS